MVFLKNHYIWTIKVDFHPFFLGEHNVHLPKISRNEKDLGQGKLLIFIEHNYEEKCKVGFIFIVVPATLEGHH
jgi:hypothetical protein